MESTYANVYRVKYNGGFACLKKIKKEKYYPSLINEVFLLKQFSHPNIVRVLDDSNLANGEVILELADTDLFEYTRHDSYAKVSFLDKIYPQMLAAIEEVHRKRLIHIDIKLENFLVFPGEIIKLCDFGLAQKINDPPPAAMKGTVTYISPEMVLLKQITPRHDYWSLAVCIYILITCNDPWPGKSSYTIMENIISAKYYDFPSEIKNNPEYKKYIDIIMGELRSPITP